MKSPSWFDPRLVLGIVLVLGSVALGAVLVSRADSSQAVIAVSHDLAAGTVLTADDVHTTRVRLSSSARLYLSALVVRRRPDDERGAGRRPTAAALGARSDRP